MTCRSCGSQVLVSFDGDASIEVPAEAVSDGPPSGFIAEPLSGSLFEELSAEISHNEPLAAAPVEAVPENIPSDMAEVAEFGNSAASQAREGTLRFDIYISGIDTADIRTEVSEALDDARFVWDSEALMARLSNGELVLKDVSAVKSAIILQRLRSISVDIRWEQHAIHQS